MSRYPYTVAYDALRSLTERKPGQRLTFSRSEAAKVCQYIADALGMDKEGLAKRIADHSRALEVGL